MNICNSLCVGRGYVFDVDHGWFAEMVAGTDVLVSSCMWVSLRKRPIRF